MNIYLSSNVISARLYIRVTHLIMYLSQMWLSSHFMRRLYFYSSSGYCRNRITPLWTKC